jgi:hypothetical protein
MNISTALDLKKSFGNAKQGDRIVYFTGNLMFSRQFSKTVDESDRVDRLANAAWKLSGAKWDPNARPAAKNGNTGQWVFTGERRALLMQRKLAEPFGTEYIIEKL